MYYKIIFCLLLVVSSYGEPACTAPAVSMETGDIIDSQLTASTGDPSEARLNGPKKAWCTDWPTKNGPNSPGDTNGYIQILVVFIVSVQWPLNPSGNKDYLTEYKMRWSYDGIIWKESSQVLKGNINWHDVKKKNIPVIYARYLRLLPLKWYIWACPRMEVYGEPWPEVQEVLFTPTGPDKALLGHMISSRTVADVMQCMKLCLVTKQRKSFNFNPRVKKCEVSDSKTEKPSLGDQEGFTYYEAISCQVIST